MYLKVISKWDPVQQDVLMESQNKPLQTQFAVVVCVVVVFFVLLQIANTFQKVQGLKRS